MILSRHGFSEKQNDKPYRRKSILAKINIAKNKPSLLKPFLRKNDVDEFLKAEFRIKND